MLTALSGCFDASGTTMLHICKRQPVYKVMTFINHSYLMSLLCSRFPTILLIHITNICDMICIVLKLFSDQHWRSTATCAEAWFVCPPHHEIYINSGYNTASVMRDSNTSQRKRNFPIKEMRRNQEPSPFKTKLACSKTWCCSVLSG